MKRLREFDYHEPSSVREAVQILAESGTGARVLAGGTDLVVDMKTERVIPTSVVNLKRIPGLAGIEPVDGGTRIGALTKVTEIQDSQLVHERHPALADAASILGPPPVRALATIGGNVGRASPASDLGPALIVSAARATIEGGSGVRDELVEDLYAGPGTTTLAVSDIITSFFVPTPPPGFGSAYVKLGKRASGTDIAVAGAAASVVIGDDGEITSCRIALSSLGPTPMRVPAAERELLHEPVTEAALDTASRAARGEASPIADMRAGTEYRLVLAEVMTRRALRRALRSAGVEVAA